MLSPRHCTQSTSTCGNWCDNRIAAILWTVRCLQSLDRVHYTRDSFESDKQQIFGCVIMPSFFSLNDSEFESMQKTNFFSTGTFFLLKHTNYSTTYEYILYISCTKLMCQYVFLHSLKQSQFLFIIINIYYKGKKIMYFSFRCYCSEIVISFGKWEIQNFQINVLNELVGFGSKSPPLFYAILLVRYFANSPKIEFLSFGNFEGKFDFDYICFIGPKRKKNHNKNETNFQLKWINTWKITIFFKFYMNEKIFIRKKYLLKTFVNN